MIFSEEQIAKIEAHYNAKYVGDYDLDKGTLDFTVTGAVFYVENPDRSKGHSNYFGLFRDWEGGLLICNAEKITEKRYPAILMEDGTFLVSRGRHDYVSRNGAMLDGGGSGYIRVNPKFPVTHHMRIIDGKEVFVELVKNETLDQDLIDGD